MVDAWINCVQCGHRFDAYLPYCPRCNTPNQNSKIKRKGMGKGKKIAIGVGAGIGGFFLLIIIIGLAVINAQPNPYISEEYGFTIKYPTGWILRENYDSGANHVIASFSSPDNAAMIYVRSKAMEGQLFSAFVDKSKEVTVFNNKEEGFTYTSDRLGQISGHDARIVTYSLNDGEDLTGKQVILHSEDLAYFITFQSDASTFVEYSEYFEQSVQSFSFLHASARSPETSMNPVSIQTDNNDNDASNGSQQSTIISKVIFTD